MFTQRFPKLTATLSTLCLGIAAATGATFSTASTAQADSAHGFPVCFYASVAAYENKNKERRACFRLGAHNDLDDPLYRNITKHGAGYVDIKPGYSVKLYRKDFWKGEPVHLRKDKAVDIPKHALRSIRVIKNEIGDVEGYPLCLYRSEEDFIDAKINGQKVDRACFPFGEYQTFQLEQFGYFNDLATYVDLREGYSVRLFEHENFGGRSAIVREDGQLYGKKARKASSLTIIQD
ncbi:hypothetical protein EI983_18950 [Roseovarius faecimaris]|uniref:Beta/gamma crystallin 'Greek key' domain-containing protein n=1 Tax=Roseovarius faecimaris TaxID=2494550 RepID=A0A6I6IT21_9RHOB|nr:hypothetical protein [Roseovarius faecimaris]QGY00230.1 hypothetical protein EI983_18950 [Roseovarius faecimaris]